MKKIIEKEQLGVREKLERFFVYAQTKNKDITLKELKKIENESYDLPQSFLFESK